MASMVASISTPVDLQTVSSEAELWTASPRADAEPASIGELPIAILGVPFDPMTIAKAADRIETMIEEGRPRYVVTPNVDFLVQARHDEELHRILVNADLVLCDGKPLVWASRWLGNSLPGRVAGSDLVPVLLDRAEQRGWKIFVLGGSESSSAEAVRRIAEAHPSLPAVAHYSPPLCPLAEMDHDDIIARIRAARADLVLVCFGCPKQEKWIFHHYRAAGVPVMLGAGGTVDFLAGRLKRAPTWMRHTGTEWFYRLVQEPRRLFKRYATDLMEFGPALIGQLWHLSSQPRAQNASGRGAYCTTTPYGISVRISDRLQYDVLRQASLFWMQTVEQRGHCLLDLADVKSIDSTGLAFLAHWQRHLAETRRNLILLRPSPVVCEALERMHLTEHFVITDGVSPGVRFSAGRGLKPARNGRL